MHLLPIGWFNKKDVKNNYCLKEHWQEGWFQLANTFMASFSSNLFNDGLSPRRIEIDGFILRNIYEKYRVHWKNLEDTAHIIFINIFIDIVLLILYYDFFSIYNQSLNLRNLKDQHNNGNQSDFHLPSGHVIKCLGVDPKIKWLFISLKLMWHLWVKLLITAKNGYVFVCVQQSNSQQKKTHKKCP